MPDSVQSRSRLLDALDGPDLPDPGPSVPSGLPNGTEPQNETSEDAMNALRRRLDAIPQLTPAMRFAPTPNARNKNSRKRPRYSELPNACPVALLSPDSLLGGSSSQRHRPSPSRMRQVNPGGPDDSPIRPPAGSTLRDFSLYYDTETPVRAIDRGGHDQEQQMKDFVHQTLDDMNHGRTVKESLVKLGLADLEDVIPGLNVHLMPHQVVGVSWMLDQENGPYRGGILADDMGLGKTVQMIATMAVNGPKEDSKSRTTLIVVPAALIQQWKDELESKANGMFEVHIHHSTYKLKNLKDMKEKDVIITTYHTLNAECMTPDDVDDADEVEWVQKHGGLLPRMSWHRVVLDEAQFIRNRKTFSSRSVAMLKATYRWCLTGTPITNTLVDVYGLIRFGKFRPWNDWDDFNEKVGKVMTEDLQTAGMRTRAILNNIMLRRSKTTKNEDGKPLVELPPKEIDLVHLDFSKEEREIYDAYEKNARMKINRFIKRGTLLKNSTAVLVMILRLRQLSCHPYLIVSQGGDISDPNLVIGSEVDKEFSRVKKIMPMDWIAKVKKRFLLRAQAEQFDFPDDAEIPDLTCPICFDTMTTDTGRVLECGDEICFECMLDLSKSALSTTTEVSHDEKDEKAWETAAAKGLRPCPTCKKMVSLTMERAFRMYAFEPEEDEVDEAIRARKKARKNKNKQGKGKSAKGDAFLEIDDSDDGVEVTVDLDTRRKRAMAMDLDSEDEFPDVATLLAAPSRQEVKKEKKPQREEEESDDDDDEMRRDKEGPKDKAFYDASINTYSKSGANMEASAKMLHMLELLREWDASGDKSIVYSQWTSMLDLVETIFLRQGIRWLRYDGKMNRESRERALREFRQPGGPKVILISIKCGGVGLNLVSANRVINLDLSWNYATESQAYDRVHRVGQDKDVTVKRLVIKNTLEERMLDLQELKNDLSDAALGEASGMKLHKLNVREIKRLFGFSNVSDNRSGNRRGSP